MLSIDNKKNNESQTPTHPINITEIENFTSCKWCFVWVKSEMVKCDNIEINNAREKNIIINYEQVFWIVIYGWTLILCLISTFTTKSQLFCSHFNQTGNIWHAFFV